MSEPLQRVLAATGPLTLAGVPSGFLPWLAADLARAAFGSGKARAVVIAADEAAMRALADTAPLFAPGRRGADLPGLGLPALRPRFARLARDGGTPGDAERAAKQARESHNCSSPRPMRRRSGC